MPCEFRPGDPHMLRKISSTSSRNIGMMFLLAIFGAAGCGDGTKPDTDTSRDTSRDVEDSDAGLDVDDADPGVDADSGAETDADTDTDSTLEDIVLTACSANRDCAGGQVCRDGYCRTACAASAECTPPLSVCDEAKGYCVDCVGDGDCGNNRACSDGMCAFYCREDSACSAEEFCVFETGACAVRECESSLECSGGYRCDRFVCVPIDEIICEPDEVTCSGDFGAIETCNGDGTGVESAPCETGMRCVDSGAGVACATVVCTPNEVGCEGGLSIFACDSSGTVKTVTGCEMGQYCNAGVCEDQVCEPSSVVCDSDSVVTCDEFGASEAVEACGEREGCDGELGCRCVDGECRPRICAPASARCVPGSLEGREICDADGLAYVAEACDSSKTCVAGECLPRVCAPNMPKCVGADGSQTCFADGLGFAQTVSCNPGSSCLTSTGLCSPWICTHGTTSCATTGIRRTCNEDGLGFTDIACGQSSTCNSGNCSPWICTPNSFSCLSVNARQQCNADGLAYSSTPCSGPAANGYACLGQGLCAERVCIPGSAGPCASLTERQTCNADGQAYSTNSCAVNQSCSGGICQDRICTAGNTRCVAGSLTGREVCAGDGLAWNNAPCGSTESCSGSGNCLPRICTPGTSRCVAGSLTGRETCAADGLSWTSTACSASQSCTGAGSCQERVCTPSSLSCVGTATRRVCAADGLSFVDNACGAGTSCSSGTCRAWECLPGSLTCSNLTTVKACSSDGLVNTTSSCSAGQSCSGGVCALRCGDSLVGTGEACDDGNTQDGDTCSAACTLSCLGGTSACGGTCYDLSTSETHCGSCGSTCSGECQSGVCQACVNDGAVKFSGNTCSCLPCGSNANNNYVSLPSSPTLGGLTSATVEFFARLDAYSQYAMFLNGQGSAMFTLAGDCGYGGNRYKAIARWSTADEIYSISTVPLGAWRHYALTFQNGTIRFFIDGVLQGTKNIALATTTAPTGNVFLLGGAVDGGNGNNNHQLSGAISAVRISKTSRYSANFAAPSSLSLDANTLHLYELNELIGTTTVDSANSSLVGTFVRSPQWETYQQSCSSRICTPGTTRCVSGTLTGREVCSADGMAWTPSNCAASSTCVGGGTCQARICAPGESRCVIGSLTGRETCESDGLSWKSSNCSSNQTCTGVGVCQARVCLPSLRSCLSSSSTRTCAFDGLSFADSTCSSGTSCRSGICEAWTCQPGAAVCGDNQTLRICNPDGQSYSTAACGSGQTCSAGVCAVRCGDGVKSNTEACDDGNNRDGDSCSASCQKACSGAISACDSTCQDLMTSENDCGSCGTLCSGTCLAGVCQTCSSDGALKFSGSTCSCIPCGDNANNNYVSLATSPSLGGLTAATVEVYARVDAYSQYGMIVNGPNSLHFSIAGDCAYGTDRNKLIAKWGTQDELRSISTIPLGTWRHYALTFQNGTIRLYVDGVLNATKTIALSTTSAPTGNVVLLGGAVDGGNGNNNHQFSGAVRAMRISTSLRYSADFTPPSSLESDASTLHLYKFDESVGTKTYDSINPSFFGTFVRSPQWEVAGETCTNRLCTPGTSRCAGNSLSGREVCSADGMSWDAAPCGSSETCTGSGACMPQVCSPNINSCVNASVKRACSQDGLSLIETMCDTATTCVTGTCVDSCIPVASPDGEFTDWYEDQGVLIFEDFLGNAVLGGLGNDMLQVELYENISGTFNFSSGIDSNYSTCNHCLRIFEDETTVSRARQYYPFTGSMSVSPSADVTFTDVRLIEVTVDPQTYFSSPVAGGRCVRLSNTTLSTP